MKKSSLARDFPHSFHDNIKNVFIDLLNKSAIIILYKLQRSLFMKKRVFLAAGVAVLSAAVLAACSSGNANKEAKKPVTYAYVFS